MINSLDFSLSTKQSICFRLEKMASLAVSAIWTSRAGILEQEMIHRDGKNELVTSADKASHLALVQAAKEYFPDIEFVSEESEERVFPAGDFLIADDLDGTFRFANGDPTWGVMVGYVSSEGPLAGVVTFPDLHVSYSGVVGMGGMRNGRQFFRPPSPKPGVIFSDGPWHDSNPQFRDVLLPFLEREGFSLVPAQSASDTFRRLFEGEGSIAFSWNDRLWDACAGTAILKALGGTTAAHSDFSESWRVLPKSMVYGWKEEEVRRLAMLLTSFSNK
jgi:fructose-1,6-bisphosphatase/inositol monophosphatase family enzyme